MSENKRINEAFPIYDSLCMRLPETVSFNAKPFDIDNVAAYWIHHHKWTVNMNTDVGPLRLPFPVTWMEHGLHRDNEQEAGVLPNGWMMMELQAGDRQRERMLREYGAKDQYPDEILLLASLFWKSAHADDHAVLCWVTEDGKWLTSMVHVPAGSKFLAVSMRLGKTQQEAVSEIRSMFNPIALAIGLTNCRNIDVDTLQTRDRVKKKHKNRYSEPGIEYRVIRLPGAPSNRVDGPVQTSGKLRLHTVRGHFKTYTKEKPLYGKLTGTWWWSPAVRGKKENGEIISSYEQATA